MRGVDAKAACPELQIVQVPTAHGKADLTYYRSAGKKVTYMCRVDMFRPTVVVSNPCYQDTRSEFAQVNRGRWDCLGLFEIATHEVVRGV